MGGSEQRFWLSSGGAAGAAPDHQGAARRGGGGAALAPGPAETAPGERTEAEALEAFGETPTGDDVMNEESVSVAPTSPTRDSPAHATLLQHPCGAPGALCTARTGEWKASRRACDDAPRQAQLDREFLGRLTRDLGGDAEYVISEMYSPPRVTAAAARLRNLGVAPGFALDLTTADENGVPWDFDLAERRQKARAKFHR